MQRAMVIGLLGLFVALPVWATPVTLSGQITYDGEYHTAQFLYVALLDIQTLAVVGIETLAVAGTPFAASYSLTFDNDGVSEEAGLYAILDVDNSGIGSDIDSLATAGDVIGYYDGVYEPDFVSTGVSQSGLDFALPKAEIHGYVELVDSRAPVHIEFCSCAGHWCPWAFDLPTSGNYSFIVYAGDWFVRGVVGDYEDEYCYVGAGGYCDADPDCTALTLGDADVLTGIDFEISTPIETLSWGSVKAMYGR